MTVLVGSLRIPQASNDCDVFPNRAGAVKGMPRKPISTTNGMATRLPHNDGEPPGFIGGPMPSLNWSALSCRVRLEKGSHIGRLSLSARLTPIASVLE